jgi:hypothetical protein
MEKEFKKSILLFFAAVLFLSCEKTQISSITLQANFNTNFFKAYSVSAQANNTDQLVTIVGLGPQGEVFKLHTEWRGADVYKVGGKEINYATLKSANDSLYTTKSEGSSGTITITNQDEGKQELAGEFDFTFITATDTINVRQGLFYSVPYEITD